MIRLIARLFALNTVLLINACALDQPLRKPDYAPTPPQPTIQVKSTDGAIYAATSNRFLFEDIKARRPGDLITVLLEESTNASKSASTNTKKNTSINMPSPTLFGVVPSYRGNAILENNATSDLAFSGGADSSQSNQLRGKITVTIAHVYENGNMLVRGEKILTLNQGSEVVRISGIVRPSDVTPDNTVKSTHIANAEITYSGNGAVADSNTAGWLTRILGSVLWPF